MNPIEQVFAKLKHFLRKTAARTVETICTAISEIFYNAPTLRSPPDYGSPACTDRAR